MGKNLQFRRGLESQVLSANLLASEPGYSIDEKKLHIGEATFLDEEKTYLSIKNFKDNYAESLDFTAVSSGDYKDKVKINDAQKSISLLKNNQSISGVNADKIYEFYAKQEDITLQNSYDIESAYLSVLNTMRTRFSLSNSASNVDNCIENAPMLSAVINGETINCIYKDINWITENSISGQLSSNKTPISIYDLSKLTPSTSYILYVEVEENTRSEDYKICAQFDDVAIDSECIIQAKKTGTFKFNIITKNNFENCTEALKGMSISELGTGAIKFKRSLIEHTDKAPDDIVPDIGLTSVRAAITHNNSSYLFYTSKENELRNAHIELNKLESDFDTLIINRDKDSILIQKTYKIVLNGSESEKWMKHSSNEHGLVNFYLNGLPYQACANSAYICPQYNSDDTLFPDAKKESLIVNGAGLYLRKQSHSGADSLLLLKADLRSNPITVIYKLETPLITIIPKRINQTIIVQKENSFFIDSVLNPSDCYIEVATNCYEKQLNEIASLANNLDILSALSTYR